jgi:hypothetical protein
MARRKTDRPPNLIKLPISTDWKGDFQRATFRTNFYLQLTHTQLELFCAIADGVEWDRGFHNTFSSVRPNNWIASEAALTKRGLIYRIPLSEQPKRTPEQRVDDFVTGVRDYVRLTPAGEALAELLRVTGVFIKADAAILKEHGR